MHNEQKRSALDTLQNITGTYVSRAMAGEPLDSIRQDYQSVLDANPYLTPIDKDKVFQKGLTGLEEAHIRGRLQRGEPIDTVLDDLRGGALLDTDANPELRAKPFDQKPAIGQFQPTKRFSSQVNSAINQAAEANGLDPGLLATFAQIESSGRAGAKTGSYYGLFQLSKEEFAKYGGNGNIYNPEENANAAARKLKAEAELFQQQYGRPASPIDLYMQHQQGIEGYAAHLANPTAPAWQNMLSTGEGQQKGEKWAKAAIWGNIPTDVRRKFPGGVDSVTSADFVGLWQDKVDRFGGGVAPSSGSSSPKLQFTGPYQNLPANRRKVLIHEIQIAARNKTLQDIKDSAELAKRTGQIPVDVHGETALDRAKRFLTPNQIQKAKIDLESAHIEYNALHDLPQLTEAELQQRLTDFAPQQNDTLYAERQRVFNKLIERTNEIRDQRFNDPAASVLEDPRVKVADQGVQENPGDPEYIQKSVAARLDAQNKIGIPPGLQKTVTKREARNLMAPAYGLDDPELTQSLIKLHDKLEQDYGPYAPAVGRDLIQYFTKSKDVADQLIPIISQVKNGIAPKASQIRALERAQETALSVQAFGGLPDQPEAMGAPGQQSIAADPFAQMGIRRPPQAAIDHLKADPRLAPQFEAKYGAGSASIALQEIR